MVPCSRAIIGVHRQMEIQKELNCTMVISLCSLTLKTFPVRRASQPQSYTAARSELKS